MKPDHEFCLVNQVHPNGRIHAEHHDEEFVVPRERTLPKVLTVPSRTYTFSVINRAAQQTLAAPLAPIGKPEVADYTVQHWAMKVWRVESVHRCDRCGDIIEVGSYLMVSLYTLNEEPLVSMMLDDGAWEIE